MKPSASLGLYRPGEAGKVRAIKRVGRKALRDVQRALPQFQADRAGHALLRYVKKPSRASRNGENHKPL